LDDAPADPSRSLVLPLQRAVIVVSESMKELFVHSRDPGSKVTVIDNWIDEDEIKPMPGNPLVAARAPYPSQVSLPRLPATWGC